MDAWDVLAPWDTLRYFDTPKITTIVSPSAGQQIVGPNPNRVGLFLINGVASNSIAVSPDPNAGANVGIGLSATWPYVAITARDFGPLVTLAWYYTSNTPHFVVAIEIVLKEWPSPEALKNA